MKSYYVGLISGTSMDGIDAVVLSIDPTQTRNSESSIELLAGHTFEFEPALMDALTQARRRAETDPDAFLTSDSLQHLDQALAQAFANTALMIIDQAQLKPTNISAIGCHGQTVIHQPDAHPPISRQLGDCAQIAGLTGILTIGQFRQADLEAGGQGAPLAPLLHQGLFADPTQTRGILNLGGIANLTLLRHNQPVTGFDTGPANVFLDRWCGQHTQHAFDANGDWARGGQVHSPLLECFLQEPYFQQPPPKSTGIEYFGQSWLDHMLVGFEGLEPVDVQATLSELTAQSVAQEIERLGGVDQLIVCGGGAHNTDLLDRLHRALPNCDVSTSNQWGVSSDHLEAILFAWLAHERLAKRLMDTRSITGAQKPVLLGTPYPPLP
ncbi:MAG TPA: anhydro-N-acetylmuramic acid kinase [Wenzhouxiangella sp.]